MNKLVIPYTIGVFLLIPLPSKSTEMVVDTKELYQLLQSQAKQLKRQQGQIEELRTLVLKQQTQPKKRLDITDNKVKKIARSNTKVALNKKGLQIKSNNGDFSFKAGGRIHTDFAHFDDDVTQMASGAILRRARIKLAGRLFRDWRYKAEIDFAEKGDVGAKAVWLSYTGWKHASFKLGHFKEPFSLEEMTSSNAITFMERALPNEFAPSYHLGFAASGYGDYWSLSGGLFGEANGTRDDDIDDGWGLAGRAPLAPFHEPGQLLHLGFSSEYRRLDSNDEVQFRTRPESSVTNRRLVNTGTIEDSEYTLKLNAEIAAVYGPFSLQGEYFHTRVDRSGLSDLSFDGSYIYASYFITGESRPYSVSDGEFLPVDPLHQYGAWELGLRYSTIDLDDHDIHGGKQDNYTVGLNWYANYNLRFMLNYTFVDAHPNGNAINEDPNILQFRGQVFF
jgi:phosphate-selective porin OprO/OprP